MPVSLQRRIGAELEAPLSVVFGFFSTTDSSSKEAPVGMLPETLQIIFANSAAGFSPSVFNKFLLLMMGAILTSGRRTVSHILLTVQPFVTGHPSSYHRVLSHRVWSMWSLARPIIAAILDTFCPVGVVCLAGDETVTEHPGKKVYGKDKHRDAKRSTKSFMDYLWGHGHRPQVGQVALAILVKLPGTTRPWALPVLIALYHSREENKRLKRRHKTPCDLMRQLLCVLQRWFPTRKFVFSGDGGYASHEFTKFAKRHASRLTLISRFHGDAALYVPPPRRTAKTKGRPRVIGLKLPTPQEVVATTKKRKRLTVAWYGGQSRRVEVVTGTGGWYRSGAGVVEVRWVFVHDLSGTHRDEYFYTTDVKLSAAQVIEYFTGRWSIEVTFQEVRAHLGVETTRGRICKTVLRAEPLLFGLYSIVVLWWSALSERERQEVRPTWVGKETLTFSDVFTAVRRDLWRRFFFANPVLKPIVQKLSPKQRRLILELITLAA